MSRGLLIIISGPSGTGKGTVVDRLVGDSRYAKSISWTTRGAKVKKDDVAEIEGVDYFFHTEDEFRENLRNDGFLESASFAGHYYGTPRSYVDEMMDAGKIVVLEIDVNGALQVKKRAGDAVLIFLLPPSKEELRRRLVRRERETAEEIEERISIACREIKTMDKYDYVVINDEVSLAAERIQTIVAAESMRTERRGNDINKILEELSC